MSVRLRRLRQADGARVLTWRNLAELGAHMYNDHVIDQAEHAIWLSSALNSLERRYWIIELHGEPVGIVNLVGIDLAVGACEWAFYIADPAVRGKGVGAAIAYLALGHVFDVLGLSCLRGEVLAHNSASLRLHALYGFTREALLLGHVRKAGLPRDVVVLGLSARAWPQVKAAAEARLVLSYDLRSLSLEA